MGRTYTAQEYLKQLRAGSTGPAYESIAQALINARMPDVQLRMKDLSRPFPTTLGVGYNNTWADLPTPLSTRVSGGGASVMFGSRPMVYVPGMENLAVDPLRDAAFGPASDVPWNNLGGIVASTARGVQPSRIGIKLRPAISRWGALHLQDLNAARGQINAGNIAVIARRRKIFFNDAGTRARQLEEKSQAFVNAVLGNKGSNPVDPLVAFSDLRRHVIEEHARALRVTAPGKSGHLNLRGIKESSFKRIKRFKDGEGWITDTELLVNTGSPHEHQAFGNMADVLSGDQHINQYVAFDLVSWNKNKSKKIGSRYFSLGQQHPLLAGSSYGDDLAVMGATLGKKVGTFGTTIRADVGYLVGQGAELFASHALGDSGMLALSTRMLRASGYTSAPYEVTISGVKGMHGLPNPTTELHKSFMDLPGVKDFLASPDQKILQFERPQKLGLLKGEGLAALTGGKRIKAIKGFDFRDRVTQLVKTSTGIRVSMRRARPHAYAARQVTLNGARGTIGIGRQIKGLKGLDLLAYDMKSGDPVVARQRWAAHYADTIFGHGGLSRDQRELALKTFADFSGFGVGTHYGAGKKGQIFLHTEGIRSDSAFLTGDFSGKAFREKLAGRLNEVLGTKFTARSLAPRIKKFGRDSMVDTYMSSGMDEVSANKAADLFIAKMGGKATLSVAMFKGQNVKFRSSDVGGLKGRVAINDARNLYGKLIDYSGPNANLASKMADIVGGRISDVEDYVKFAQTAQMSTVLGSEAVEGVVKAAGGKIKIAKLSDLASEALFSEINKSLDDTGTLSPELYTKLMNRFGMEKSDYGLFVDFRGTRLSGLATSTGSRTLGSADAVTASSDFGFLHNLGRLAPELNRKSTTGFAGDIARMPRKEIVEGLEAHENKSLGVLSNAFNAYLEVLNPYASKGAMERRLWLAAASGREWMLGSKGIAAKTAAKGFKAGRYNAFNLATLDNDFAVGLTEEGILRKFGGSDGSAGKQMVEDLKAGKEVYTFFKRDPVQSAQQLAAVRLTLVNKQSRDAKNYLRARRALGETAFVSRMLAGASQGDFDGDTIALFLLKNMNVQKGMAPFSYSDQQKVIGDMYRQNKIAAKFFGDMLDNQALAATDGIGKITTDNLAQVMAGKKWEALVDPTKTPTEILEKIGIPKNQIDNAYIEALGTFQRMMTSQVGVGVMHTYATRMQDVYSSLSSPKMNKFNLPFDVLTNKAKELGLEHLTHSQNADWIRLIYGFLQKKTTSTESTLATIHSLQKAASGIDPSGQEYRKIAEQLAEQLKQMSEGVSGSKNAFYNFARELSVKHASSAAASGAIDLKNETKFYSSLADEMMKVSRFEAWASQHGRTATTTMARGRVARNVNVGLLEQVLGRKVSMPATDMAGAELNAKMVDFVDGIAEGNVKRVAQSAAQGLDAAVSRAGGMVDSLASKVSGWGNLKTAAVVGGTLGVVGLLGRGSGKQNQAPAPEMDNVSGGAPMPPQPMVGFPSDGARPSALAPSMDTARIARVPGQRRHFGGPDNIFMPPQFDVMGDYQHQSLRGEDLGSLSSVQGSDDFNG